jgi:uncharacterized protein YpuA (DUF1002 family)
MKKTLAVLLCFMMVFGALVPCALAAQVSAGDARVVIGADVTQQQRTQIYEYFGVTPGTVTELSVNIDEERSRLQGLVSADKIGSYSLSCVFIRVRKEGEGIDIQTNNIDWCTADMYRNALLTAGITDAEVRVSAPFSVSGTAALTGIYKAYEDITGTTISEQAKDASTQELVVTGDLAQVIGSEDATALINELKLILNETKDMSDEEVKAEITDIASKMGYTLTDEEIAQILSLIRSLEKLDVSQLQQTIQNALGAVDTVNKVNDSLSSFGQKVSSFFSGIADFFRGLFGGGQQQ